MSLFSFGFKKSSSQESPPAKKKAKVEAVEAKAVPGGEDEDEDEDDLLMLAAEQVERQQKKKVASAPQVLAPTSAPLTKKVSLDKPEKAAEKTKPAEKKKKKRIIRKKRKAVIDSSDESDGDASLGDSDDGSDDEYVVPKTNGKESDEDDELDSLVNSDEEELDHVAAKPTKVAARAKSPVKRSPVQSPHAIKSTGRASFSTPPKAQRPFMGRGGGSGSPVMMGSPLSAPSSPTKVGALPYGDHEHHRLHWLAEDQIMDKKKRRAGEAGYDPTTLYVPDGYIEGQAKYHAEGLKPRKITAAMRLWWNFKRDFFDTVLFFKVGKFYEIYHMDADVAVNALNLVYMKGDVAHCGFPEKAYGKYSEKLVDLGFRVARIEQTETPAQQKERSGKASGPVRREVCGVLSKGTRTLDVRDGAEFENSADVPTQLVGLYQSGQTVGVCVMDTTTGRCSIGQFEDSSNHQRLRMLLARERPAELVYGRDNLQETTLALLRSACPYYPGSQNTVVHSEVPGVSSELEKVVSATLARLKKNAYFDDGKEPEVLAAFREQSDVEQTVAIAAFGICLRLLTRHQIDRKVVSMGNFSKYELPGTGQETEAFGKDQMEEERDSDAGHRVVLDSQAIANLDLLSSGIDAHRGSPDGSLLAYMDHCVTRFGKRQLAKWLSAPLLSAHEIRKRQAKVTALLQLFSTSEVLPNAKSLMKGMPDMERMLTRIHNFSVKDPSHPDSRAIVYDLELFNKSKIGNLVQTLKGASTAIRALDLIREAIEAASTNTILQPLLEVCTIPSKEWSGIINTFSEGFDLDAAKLTGSIVPTRGSLPSYDAAAERVQEAKSLFQAELDAAHEHFQGAGRSTEIKFWQPKTGRDLYQIEVPNAILAKCQEPSSYILKTKTKSARRFHTKGIVATLAKLSLAESSLDEAKSDATRLVFEKFDQNRPVWNSLIARVRELDCLISLATVSGNSSEESPMCLPELIETTPGGCPVLDIKQGRHPCVAQQLERQGKSYIPNDISLGGQNEGSCLLLTGPNMGGKSSLCRQAAIAVIMAQLGCYVSAESCRLTPVDRVFTRLGASDFIMSGQSTFFVELDETATVLHHATERSLVILDELGRGTSTHDGAAIAYAVVERLCNLKARTIFATHYHALVEDFATNNMIKTAHMACFARPRATDSNSNADSEAENVDVTFLYKLEDGPSDKSHGLNVARLAKLPNSIIETAHRESVRFEQNFLAEKISAELQLAVEQNAGPEVLERLWHRAQQIKTA
mmetsp:Transcript_7643/g.13381  ORF Transcript_7643/g.13381 Transcript_7643/m.13381 type:complete len:1258 (+) Transcript_7643:173-3946(+)